ncbi:hypothetical protein L1F30_16955 [Simiduia sp. 21SJ11W-1]|uniref:hypothetical protein n=1 Tax=Simiduia sp. 21SJ11W-1 TaxID=2909669 RepID=UPI00209CE654|nr:hypothetical protein [Simiduia sp. 21SJ11W-1]UTA47830.1 hypothetical protein L1F30_16955 [Simiduia sp. 21SJ11W-1]
MSTRASTPVKIATAALILALVGVVFLLLGSEDHYELEIPLAEIPVDKPLYREWHGQQLVIIRPRSELLAGQYDGRIIKAKPVVDPPERTSREAYPIKVYSFDRNHGYLMFGFHKWYTAIIPCAAFHYIDQPFKHRNDVVEGGFKCSQSLDEFWQDKLVFNLFGRSQSPELPDLYMPYYRIVEDTLIVGLK